MGTYEAWKTKLQALGKAAEAAAADGAPPAKRARASRQVVAAAAPAAAESEDEHMSEVLALLHELCAGVRKWQ